MKADTYIVLIVSFAIPQDATFTEVLRIDFDDTGAFSTSARQVSVLDPTPDTVVYGSTIGREEHMRDSGRLLRESYGKPFGKFCVCR